MQARKAVLCAALVAASSWFVAFPASAATIVVTERADVVADDGRCSLREAVRAANANAPSGAKPGECVAGDPLPTVDVIQLRRGKYLLSRGAGGDDANEEGDLDVTQSVAIVGKGPGKTKIASGYGQPIFVGDGDRVLHVDPAGLGGVAVTLRKLSIVRGDVGCDGAGCTTGASAIEVGGDGPLVLDAVHVKNNTAYCSGDGCGDARHGAAIRSTAGGSVTLVRSRVRGNRSQCLDPRCTAGAAAIVVHDERETPGARLVLDRSVVASNRSYCFADGCTSGGIVVARAGEVQLDRTRLNRNTVQCDGASCSASSLYDAEATRVFFTIASFADSFLLCEGDGCETRNAVQARAPAIVSAVDLDVVGTNATCAGTDCNVGDVVDVLADEVFLDGLEIEASALDCTGPGCSVGKIADAEAVVGCYLRFAEIVGNQTSCHGADCRVRNVVELASQTFFAIVHSSTIDANDARCLGERCSVQHLVDLQAPTGVEIDVASVRENVLRCEGGGCSLEPLLEIDGGKRLTSEDAEIVANATTCAGAQCRSKPILVVRGENAQMTRGRLANNRSQCDGASCDVGFGGALHNAADALALHSVVIQGNRTHGVGAAIYNAPRSALTLKGVALRLNEAGLRGTIPFGGVGGAILNAAANVDAGFVRIRNSLIRKNRAALAGGGIANQGKLELFGGQLDGNTPDDCLNVGAGSGCP